MQLKNETKRSKKVSSVTYIMQLHGIYYVLYRTCNLVLNVSSMYKIYIHQGIQNDQ